MTAGQTPNAECLDNQRPPPSRAAHRIDETRPDSSAISPATTPVRAAHRIDQARLEHYLATHVPEAAPILGVRQFAAGQSNPTYLIEGERRRFVLRKKPPGTLLPKAHLVEREYRILAALAGTDVPVPRVHHLCEDAAIVGTAFYVMDHVEGAVDQDPAWPALSPGRRRAAYDSMADVLARLHRVDWRALGLADYGREGSYIARQIRRWSGQYEASRSGTIPAMDRLLAWLPDHIPDDDETTIVHGDYRPGNLILHPHEPRIAAVLDWELSTLGHPLSDLAHNCLAFSIPRGETRACRVSAVPTSRPWDCRRKRTTGTPIARAPGAGRSPSGASTWPSPSSAWRRSARESTRAASRATRARPMRTNMATAPVRLPNWAGKRPPAPPERPPQRRAAVAAWAVSPSKTVSALVALLGRGHAGREHAQDGAGRHQDLGIGPQRVAAALALGVLAGAAGRLPGHEQQDHGECDQPGPHAAALS